ncbi:MAG TPA: hypothetical protein DHW42_01735 [Candidatus Marinimicrobia bacterium]|nr:hypothetical protein [Candidatus Neomarinimicrobiota bacterium]
MDISVISLLMPVSFSAGADENEQVQYFRQALEALGSANESITCHLTFHSKYIKLLINNDPQADKLIRRLISEKKLLCGPWYLTPNDCLAGGEALVKNLLLGNKICNEVGDIMKVGYSSLECSNNSQLPQIFNGFNIDTAFIPIINRSDLPHEFIWQGIDGSKAIVKCYYCKCLWSGEELIVPDKGVSQEKFDPTEASNIPALVVVNFEPEFDPGQVNKLVDILDVSENTRTELIALPDLFWKIKERNVASKLKVIKKISIPTGDSRGDYNTHNCARISAKNTHIEHLLQFYYEPLKVIQCQLSDEISGSEIQGYWESLLSLQDAASRCPENDNTQKNIINREYQALTNSINKSYSDTVASIFEELRQPAGFDEQYFAIVNPLPYRRTEIIEIDLDLPGDSTAEYISVEDHAGQKVSCINDPPINITPVFEHQDESPKKRYHCFLELTNIPAMGYKIYRVKPALRALSPKRKNISTSTNCLENNFIKVSINVNGTFDVYSKETGSVYNSVGYFLDTNYDHHGKLDISQRINSRTLQPTIKIIENNHLYAAYKIEYKYFRHENRENNRVKITLRLSLDRLSRFVNIDLNIVDKADNHKIDYYFPADFNVNHVYLDSRFSIEELSLLKILKKTSRFSMSINSLIALSNEVAGFTIISNEIRSVNLRVKPRAYVALPILDKKPQAVKSDLEQTGTSILKYKLSFCPYLGGGNSGQLLLDVYNRIFEVRPYILANATTLKKTQIEFLKIEPADLCYSTLKFAENSSNAVLRFFNPTRNIIQGKIQTYLPLRAVNVLSLEELVIEPLEIEDEHQVSLTVLPRKIVTLELKFSM